MSITDELRQVAAKTEEANGRCGKLYRGDLDRIADRIDEAHKHAIAYVDDRDPVTMAEHGWIRVLDMEDVPIRVGDKMETDNGTVFVVEEIAIYTWGVRLGGNGVDGNGVSCRAYPLASSCHHHRPPTVEDVLREFASDIADVLGGDDFRLDGSDELFAEYAAKLRLRGDDE